MINWKQNIQAIVNAGLLVVILAMTFNANFVQAENNPSANKWLPREFQELAIRVTKDKVLSFHPKDVFKKFKVTLYNKYAVSDADSENGVTESWGMNMSYIKRNGNEPWVNGTDTVWIKKVNGVYKVSD